MIQNIETIQTQMFSMLEEYTGATCVPTNTTKQMPAYPIISYSMIRQAEAKGTYGEATIQRDGEDVVVKFIEVLQTFSLTAQHDDEAKALELAGMISDFFSEAKRVALEDIGIVVADVGGITPRDALLTIEYEYRKGLDVTLRFNNVIDKPIDEIGIIETFNINELEIEPTLTEDELAAMLEERLTGR